MKCHECYFFKEHKYNESTKPEVLKKYQKYVKKTEITARMAGIPCTINNRIFLVEYAP